MTLAERFESGRRVWLSSLASRLLHTVPLDLFADGTSSRPEQAMLVIHVGLGHLYGIADEDSEIEGYLDANQVRRLISGYWRDGRCDPHLARTIPFLWTSFYRILRDTGSASRELLTALYASQLGRRQRGETDHDMDPTIVDRLAAEYIEGQSIEPMVLDPRLSFSLTCNGDHLGFVEALFAHGSPESVKLVTILEVFACIGDDAVTDWEIEALVTSGNQHEIFRSLPGGWPGPGPQDVPYWVRDVAINVGARMYYASTGDVPGWLIIAESDDELRAITQWTYAPGFGFALDHDGEPTMTIQITFPSDGQTADGFWRYPRHDLRSMVRLRTLIAIGIVRLDIYRINPDAVLEYVFSFGCPLPLQLRQVVRDYLREHSLPEDQVRLFHPVTPSDDLNSMSLVERNLFDRMHGALLDLRTPSPSAVGSAYRQYLEDLDSTTLATLGNVTPQLGPLEDSRERFLIAVAQGPSTSTPPLDLSVLGPHRAYVQFRVKLDEPVQLVAHVAYLDEASQLRTLMVEFGGRLQLDWDVEAQSTALATGFSEFSDLLTWGISSVVICPSPVAYNLPYHEAFLRQGFAEASYTHRVSSLEHRETAANSLSSVIGYAGSGDRHIRVVDVELDVIADLRGSAREASLSSCPSGVLHLAGHGQAGSRSFETAMEITSGAALSSARVLLDIDATDCQLVFLSACSSGTGIYHPLQLAETIPMDVAFIEAGARVVVSTTRPVNDVIAGIFAISFHQALASGASVWDSYTQARKSARTGTFPAAPPSLEREWPEWRRDIASAIALNPDDWQIYKIVGRHWL